MFNFPAKFEELLFNMFKALVVLGLSGKRAFPVDALLFPKVPVDLSGKQAFPVGDLLPENFLSSLASIAGSLEFRHLFTCSLTKAAENERPQIGQSTQFVVCDIPNQSNEKPVSLEHYIAAISSHLQKLSKRAQRSTNPVGEVVSNGLSTSFRGK